MVPLDEKSKQNTWRKFGSGKKGKKDSISFWEYLGSFDPSRWTSPIEVMRRYTESKKTHKDWQQKTDGLIDDSALDDFKRYLAIAPYARSYAEDGSLPTKGEEVRGCMIQLTGSFELLERTALWNCHIVLNLAAIIEEAGGY